MNNNELQRVTFEQAKLLKEAGFDWETGHHYSNDKDYYGIMSGWIELSNHNQFRSRFSAPTVALALKWFRDVKYKNTSCVIFHRKTCKYKFELYNGTDQVESIAAFNSYEKAESALLDELLTLIEKDNEND